MRVGKLADTRSLPSAIQGSSMAMFDASHSRRFYQCSPTFMTHWISGLLSRKHSKPVSDLTLAAAFSDKDLRVDLKELPLPCGHLAYAAVISWYSEEMRDWIEIGFVHESDLERVVRLLQEAQEYLSGI